MPRYHKFFCLLSLPALINSSYLPSTHIKRATADWPIKTGYVSFGDSFGAGMGTGVTTTDACRVGSNNYGDLLMKWTPNNDKVDFQRKVCSGDTIIGLNRQIDEWDNPKKADIATVSMGGNDVGFGNLAYYCIINPNPGPRGPWNKKNCNKYKQEARDKIKDMTDNGLRAKLAKAYKKILDKSGRDDFNIYVTSYVGFFNHDDPDCDNTSFNYWFGGYKPSWDDRLVYLSKAVRKEFNDLVDDLNNLLKGAIEDANRGRRRPQVHFAYVNGKFGNHRWCEAGNFHEPDANRQDTWFFLSGWKDVDISSAGVSVQAEVQKQETAEFEAYKKAGGITLPNADDCVEKLGTDPDPWALWKCQVSNDIKAEPDGNWAKNLKLANEEIKKGDIKAQHIGYFYATRQIKTFHPRSPGMVAYRDAVIEAIRGVQAASAVGGKCKVKVKEIWTCEAVDKNLYAELVVTGADGKVIYSTPQSTHSPGLGINAAFPLKLKENGMKEELVIVGEHTNDYIQFKYGSTSWTSGTTTGNAQCKLNGNNWNKDGPKGCPNAMASVRTFDCEYPC